MPLQNAVLLTTCHGLDQLELEAFREAGGAGKPVHVKFDVSAADSTT